MVDEPGSNAASHDVLGRYRFPIETRKGLFFGFLVLVAFALYGIAVDHRPAWSHILIGPITVLVMGAIVWLVPMTVISEAGIRRWWSTQKSNIPWSQVTEVKAVKVNANNGYPVHARLANGDDIVLIGLPPSAVDGLNSLARLGSPAP